MSEKMTQSQRPDYPVGEFKADSDECKGLQTLAGTDGKRRILRSLISIRMSLRMDEAVLHAQDEYLKEHIRENEVVKLADIPVVRDGTSV